MSYPETQVAQANAARDPQILQKLKELSDITKNLGGMVSVLRTRLEGILGPSQPAGPSIARDEKLSTEPLCPLADGLQQQIGLLLMYRADLGDLLSRLEL